MRILATYVLTSGKPTNMASPCGVNCSFSLALDMPYMKCNTSIYDNITDTPSGGGCNAIWDAFTGIFNVSIYVNQPLNQTTNLICSPARASYQLDIEFINNVLSIQPTLIYVETLNKNEDASLYFPGFAKHVFSGVDTFYGLQALNWTPSIVSWYRDQQLLSVINGMRVLWMEVLMNTETKKKVVSKGLA